MRAYTPKDDVQKKSYYKDRFFVKPPVPEVMFQLMRFFMMMSRV